MDDDVEFLGQLLNPWRALDLLAGTMPDLQPITVVLRDGVWGCWACESPATHLPDMTPAIETGSACTWGRIEHRMECVHAKGGPGEPYRQRTAR